MKKSASYILAFLALFLLLAALFLWRFHISTQKTLDASVRQYEQLQTKLERYLLLERSRIPQSAGNEGLFAQVNRMAERCGVSARLENLRPAGKEEESLDLQLRSLYLGETMRFISLLETLDRVSIERLVMRRGVSNLLDLEVRLKRQNDAS